MKKPTGKSQVEEEKKETKTSPKTTKTTKTKKTLKPLQKRGMIKIPFHGELDDWRIGSYLDNIEKIKNMYYSLGLDLNPEIKTSIQKTFDYLIMKEMTEFYNYLNTENQEETEG